MRTELPPGMVELRGKFLQTEDLVLIDGTHVTPEEMWDVACLPFSTGKYRHAVESFRDFKLVSIFRHLYLAFSCKDRTKKMREKGAPHVHVGDIHQGFPGPEIVYGSHGTFCSLTIAMGEIAWNGDLDYVQQTAKWCSIEACPGEPTVVLMARDGIIPTDLIINGIGESPCANQMIRKLSIPLHFVDIPLNGKGKEWALEYLADQIKATVEKVSEISGKKVTDVDLNNGIRMVNDVYETYREYVEIATSAELPPIASAENVFVKTCVNDFCGDPVAMASANRSLNNELKERVRKGIRAPGIVEDPIRIYMCEKPLPRQTLDFLEDLGAIVMGPEFYDSRFLFDEPVAADTDDPCRAMAGWSLNKSPHSNTLPLKDRAEWLLDVIEKHRAEGVIFRAIWGCPIDPQYSRYEADEIRKSFDIPVLMVSSHLDCIEVGEDGKYHLSGGLRTRLEGFMEMLKARRMKKAKRRV